VLPYDVFPQLQERQADAEHPVVFLDPYGMQVEWATIEAVEDQRVLGRIDDLRQVAAAVRFLSCESLLGPLDDLRLNDIGWVIVCGESGPGARPMQQEWVNLILKQCRRAKVPFFFKQWGGVRKDRTGRELNGRTYDEVPVLLRVCE
jgi:protein gp37